MKALFEEKEDLGNNETRSMGIYQEESTGRYLVLTRTSSKWFKTERGAIKYFVKNYPDLAIKLGIVKKKVYNEDGYLLGEVYETREDSITIRSAGAGYRFDVRMERVRFHGNDVIIVGRE